MNKINFTTLKKMLIFGVDNLKIYTQEINNLNVFPVPDGDTGTNMYATVLAGKKAIENLPETSLEELTYTFSRATLMGACGNSGVILSQFLKVFIKVFIIRKEMS